MTERTIAIVGGGITGLATAYYLQKYIKEQQLPYRIQLLESSKELGGFLKTEERDGFTIERGPDSLIARKPSSFRLIEEVGLSDTVVGNATGQSYILANGKLNKMPRGSYMGIPVQVRPFLFSGLFSMKGKLRAGMDFVKPRGKETGDQSLGLFFRKRLGDEVVENLIEPLLSGIYSGDIDQLSLMSTFPNFYQLEQEHGSLIKGLKTMVPKQPKQKKKPSVFRTLTGGMSSLVNAIEERLDEGTVRFETGVDHIQRKEAGYHLLLTDGTVLKADSVVVTTPHKETERMLSQYDFLSPFKEMPATSVANVAMAFDQSAIKEDIDGTGFVVSRNEDYRITACTWTHKKWPHTTPDGKALLRVYVGKPSDQEIVNASDEEIQRVVLNDLNKVMNIEGEPEFSLITRWKESRAQYTVGHRERMETIREEMRSQLPGVYLAGASFDGLGVPDCIDQGEAAVQSVLAYLQQ
ncbi:protoporphyrinogen oxidase [Pontibacillus halophilus JSM 076056 = DSM 19796]|uniref:Coproporphyrinogen III oxidase n=2 Tax=Pontibacillus TaxID=289201 RepID=A0A0A5GKW9_9BACI|nr:protoporphyrinogen oxidase [Pontibacillus halophilus JSM 076056 = DSM 19796]